MKLPIIGIITVIFLQLGFTAYNALDRRMDSLVKLEEVVNGTNPVTSIPEISTGDVFLTEDADRIDYRDSRKSKRSSAALTYDKRQAISRSLNPMPRFGVSQTPLKSVTITYPKPRSENSESEDDLLTAGLETKPEKRSFAAKSVSVIKKPYDWIKALGSKIN